MIILFLESRLAKVTILTSTFTSPPDPPTGYWINKTYSEPAYGAVGIIDFKPAITARHVAVYSDNTEPLVLAEVEVYGKFISSNSLELCENSLKTCSIRLGYCGID